MSDGERGRVRCLASASPEGPFLARSRTTGKRARPGAAALLGACVILASRAGEAAEPEARVSVDLYGPLAEVRLERRVELAGSAGRSTETVLDFALPNAARLQRIEVTGPMPLQWAADAPRSSAPTTEQALASYRTTSAALNANAESARPEPPVEPGAVRVHLRTRPSSATANLPPKPRTALVRLTFTAPLTADGDGLTLRFPPALDPDPVAPTVSVRTHLPRATVHLDGAPLASPHARAPARASWRLGVQLAAPSSPARVTAVAATTARSRPALLASVRAAPPQGAAPRPRYDPVVFVVDQSRSVGPAGLSLEARTIERLAQRLPVHETFDAVVFARTARALFPLPRLATGEALTAVTEALVPAALANGSDLSTALSAAAPLLRNQESEPGARPLVVLLTDGALPDAELQGPADRLVQALARGPGARPEVAVLVLRPNGDEPPAGAAMARLADLVGAFGGVLRTFGAADDGDATASIRPEGGQEPSLEAVLDDAAVALARGGDVTGLRMVSGGPVANVLRAGSGAVRWVPSWGGSAALQARWRGEPLRVPLTVVRVPPRLARALEPNRPTPGAVYADTPGGLALVQWLPSGTAPTPDGIVRGELDSIVVRNALALSYRPRARACYLDRRIDSSEARALSGRVRVGLLLERGEMVDAHIIESGLHHAGVENCLREAAYALDVPRPVRRDAPVLAIANLVFKPSTDPNPPPSPEGERLGRSLEVVLGPIDVTTTYDPKDLLGPPAGAAPDGGPPKDGPKWSP